MSEMTTVNQEMIGQNYRDKDGVEWIWVEQEQEHAVKYLFDEEKNLWYKLNVEEVTYEPLIEIPEPIPTAEMGKYGSLRLKFIWRTPCLIEAIMLNEEVDITKHCEEMNEQVLNLIEEIVEKKKQSPEYKELAETGKFLPRVQMLEDFRTQAEEEILPVTVYAI